MEEKHFKILVIIPNLGRGGAQQVYRDQLRFLSNHHQIIGCVFNWEDTFEDDRSGNIISLNIPAGKNLLTKIIFFWKRVFAVREIKKLHNFDFSISHLEGADYINILSKRKEKVICWIHGTKKFDENIEGIVGIVRKKILIPLAYKASDIIVTVSEGIRQELVNNFRIPADKVKTIYNGFNVEEIYTKALQEVNSSIQEIFNSKNVLIKHCRLSKQKNLFALIDIFKLIQYTDTKLMLLGDGELRDELLNYCKREGLSVYSIWDTSLPINLTYNVYFLGYERNPFPFIRRASLYVMTSSWEGFPLALCEAMACEIPVLASDCYTGPREIISPEVNNLHRITEPVTSAYGILMPLANNRINYEIWAQTILATLKNSDLRSSLIRQGKKRILAFDSGKIKSQWLQLLQ